MTDVVVLLAGATRKTPASTLFVTFFHKITVDVNCGDSLCQNLSTVNQDRWSYLKVLQGSGILRHSYVHTYYIHT